MPNAGYKITWIYLITLCLRRTGPSYFLQSWIAPLTSNSHVRWLQVTWNFHTPILDVKVWKVAWPIMRTRFCFCHEIMHVGASRRFGPSNLGHCFQSVEYFDCCSEYVCHVLSWVFRQCTVECGALVLEMFVQLQCNLLFFTSHWCRLVG